MLVFCYRTSDGYAVAGDGAGLDDRVLLPGERSGDDVHLLEDLSPGLDEDEGEESRRYIEVGDEACGEIQLHYYDAVDAPDQQARHDSSNRYLLLPRRNPLKILHHSAVPRLIHVRRLDLHPVAPHSLSAGFFLHNTLNQLKVKQLYAVMEESRIMTVYFFTWSMMR